MTRPGNVAKGLGEYRGYRRRLQDEKVVVLEQQAAIGEVARAAPDRSTVTDDELVVHQVPALFYDRMGERFQPSIDNGFPGADLGIDGSAATANLASRAAVICDVELHPAGHFLQRLQDIWILHVVDGDVERMLRRLDELNQVEHRVSVDLRTLGLKVESEALGAKGCVVGHAGTLLSSRQIARASVPGQSLQVCASRLLSWSSEQATMPTATR